MKTTPSSRGRLLRSPRSRHVVLLTGLLLFPLAALPMGVVALPEKTHQIPLEWLTPAVTESFRLTVKQEGVIEPRSSATLISQCEWSTRILKMLPEGTWVEPGDVVVELDSSELQEKIQQREVLYVRAKADLAAAEENLRIQQLHNASSVAAAELKARLAQLDLEAYVEAEYPRQLHDLESKAALAREALVRARKQQEFVDNMVRLGYRGTSDAEKERLAVQKAEQDYELAVRKVELLKSYGHARDLTQLSGKARDLEANRVRSELMANAALLTREIRLRSEQRSYESHRAYLERLHRSLEACTIRAPQAGEVVYARTSSSSTSKIEEGSTAYYMRPLVHIPDRRHMNVALRVHETQIRHIQLGQEAVVEVGALKGQRFKGHVSSVSTVPLPGQFPYYDLREYRVTVEIDEDPDVIREVAPGLTANVEILVAYKPHTLAVPVQSVFELRGRYFVFVREGDEVVEREIQVGMSNEKSIEVVRGLEDGEQVVLQPRVRCAELLANLEDRVLSQSWTNPL